MKLDLKTVKTNVKQITIEPVLFLYALSYGCYAVITSKLYLDKICNVNLAYNRTICDNLTEYPEEQVEVQKYASSLQIVNKVLQAIPCCFFALFLGPWSDKYGRKILIICSTFGYIINNAVFIINTYYFYELKAEYLLFEVLQDCTGGYALFFLAAYSYIADITDPESRTVRLSRLDGLFPLGFYIGNACAGIIKVKLGYMYNFTLGMLFAVTAMGYTYMFVPESIPIREARLAKQRQAEGKMEESVDQDKKYNEEANFSEIFSFKNFRDAWRSLLKKREGYKRMIVILLILAFELEIFLSQGKWSSQFMFFRRHLKFTVVQYSRYTTILGIFGLAGQYIMVPILSKRFKLHDSTISLIDAFTSFVNCFVLAFCVNEWMLYIGATFAVLDSTSTTLFRSLITKTVDPDEVGKVFSIVGTFQALLPFASSPLFGFLYRETVAYFPAAFLFLVAGLKCIEAIVVVIVFIGAKRDRNNEEKLKKSQDRDSKELEELMKPAKDNEAIIKSDKKKEEKEVKVL